MKHRAQPNKRRTRYGWIENALTTTYVYDDDLTDTTGLNITYASEISTELPTGFYAADSDGYAMAVTNPEGETSVQFVDGAGRTVMTIDPTGDVTTVAYDAVQNVAGIGDLLLTSATDPLGHVDQSLSDGAGRTLQTIDAESHVTHYFYDNNSNRVSFRDPTPGNGVGEDCVFDARNREIECRDTQEIAESTFRGTGYDANSNVISMTDAKGNTDTCIFDARDRQISCTDRINAVTSYTYDVNSNLLSITDAEGGVTSYGYDARNLQIFTRYPGHPDIPVILGDYNQDGIVSQGDLDLVLLNWGSSTLPSGLNEAALPGGVFDGLISQNEQDTVVLNWGNTAPTNGALYDQVLVSYDGLHRPRVREDQLEDKCLFVYDLASRLVRKEYRLGNVLQLDGPLAYIPFNGTPDDASGNLNNASVIDFNGVAPPPQYVSGPDGAPNGALELTGATSQLAFIQGLANNFQSVTLGVWARSDQPTWNNSDVLLSRGDGYEISSVAGTDDVTVTVTQNNSQSQQVTFQPPAGFDITQWHYYLATYDASNGNLKLYVDGVLEAQGDYADLPLANNANLLTIGSYFDFVTATTIDGTVSGALIFDRAIDADEVTTLSDPTSDPTGPLTPPTDTDTFTYDKASRLLTADSERYGNTVTYTYTDDGLIDTENITGTSSGVAGYTIDRDYDANDRLSLITYPNGSTVRRTYTARDQLDKLFRDPDGPSNPDPEVELLDAEYDAAMRETSRELGNGLTRTTSYGRADHLTTAMTVETSPGSNDRPGLSWSTYGYDANKNLDTATTLGVMVNYSFTTNQDAEDRLTQWGRTNGESQSFILTQVGDWEETDGDRLVNGIITPFDEVRTHNDVHEITEINPGGGAVALEHDAKGNLTLDEDGNTYTWDFDNRLTEVRNSNDDLLGSYTYDALGRRTTKTVPGNFPGDPAVTTAYVCLTDNSGMGQQLAEYEDGVLMRLYTYGSYIDEPITMTRLDVNVPASQQTTYYHRDRQYNLVGLTDTTGAVVERYAYSPYGERRILAPDGTTVRQTSAVGNPLGHQGLYHDGETNLIYNRARYRDAGLGRWLGRDDLRYIDGFNLYQYISASVFILVDPSGHQGFGNFKGNTSTGGGIVDAGFYWGLGGSVEIDFEHDYEDCCKDGKTVKDGIDRVTVNAAIHAGIGFGGQLGIGPLDIDVVFKGPGLVLDFGGSCEFNKCDSSQGEDCCKICADGGFSVGGSVSAGAFSVSVAATGKVRASVRACYNFGTSCKKEGWAVGACVNMNISVSASAFYKKASYGLNDKKCKMLIGHKSML